MVQLQYFNGTGWVDYGEFNNEHIAWISLGGDDINYRTVDVATKAILTSKLTKGVDTGEF